MNCRTCQFELSQSLDGRLPSGRRALVMQHTVECASCATFLDELQRAQAQVLQLPRFAVSSDFRERLFERIESGEGTPDAVFRETVSLATKVRYVLTGAAAAAAVLVGFTLLREDPRDQQAPNQQNDQQVALVGTQDGARPALPRTGTTHAERASTRPSGGGLVAHTPSFDPDSAALFASVAPMTVDLVAREAADHFQQNLQAANFYATRGVRTPQAPEASALWNNAEEMQHLGQLLLDLQDQQHVEFSPGVDNALRFAVTELQAAFEGDRSDIGRVARVVTSVRNLDALPIEMRIVQRGNFSEREGNEILLRLFHSRGDTLQQLFFFLPSDGNAQWTLMDPSQRHGVFAFHGDCGPSWVVPRRLAEQNQRRMRIMMQFSRPTAENRAPDAKDH